MPVGFVKRLGRLPKRHDERTLPLAKYLVQAALPPAPVACDWTANAKQPWGYMLNDKLGDCTCAAAGHAIQVWTANAGQEITVPDQAVLTAYEAVSGYNPQTGQNDNGAVELDVLNYWRQTGVGGHTIDAYAESHPQNLDEVRQAISLFGGVYIGLSLPAACESLDVWALPRIGRRRHIWRPGSWGGHAVFCPAYDTQYIACVTWGALKKMTWEFFEAYCEEAYAVLSKDWLAINSKSPGGIDLATLEADLQAVAA